MDIRNFTSSDRYNWRFRHFPAPDPAKAHLVSIHGIQSHGGWYEHSCSRFAEAGFEVDFLDRRGSGLNDIDRGDCPSFRRLIDDIAEFLRDRKKDGYKLFLMAISWGGKLAMALPRRHPNLVDGLILNCPGMCPRVGVSFVQRMSILASRLINPKRLFDVPLSDPALFTADPERQLFIREDKLAVRQATARFLMESARLDGFLRWFAPSAVTMPVLLLLAEHDRIIDNSATRKYLDRCPSTAKQIIEYPGTHHTLEFEPNRDQFIDDVLRWLNDRIEQKTTHL
jgi:alpha-beta hydrolase superfamily lysophospholipase